MAESPIRVVIADDHDLFREGLAAILGRAPDVVVIGQATDGAGAVELARERRPDVLLLDVSMPGDSAHTTLARIRRVTPSTRVVILTMHTDEVLRRTLLASGAWAYLTKTVPSRQLLAAVRRVAEGADAQPAEADEEPRPPQLLSPREHEVLRMIAHARSNREIAEALNVVEGTVKRHTNGIYTKLGASSRIDALRKAVRLGILASDGESS